MRRIALAIVLVLVLSASAAAAPSKTTVLKAAYNKDLKATILVGVVVALGGALAPLGFLAELVSVGTLFAFVIVCAAVLVGAGGLTLYLTTADSTSKNSVCTPDPSCRALWPALKPPVTAGAGVKAALLGKTADGKQVTYKHHPLYYWAGPPPDKKPGQDGGENYFQVWFAVSPAGAAVKFK